jgi:hypothetical protein
MDGGNNNAEINLHKEWIAPATIAKTFERHSVPKEFDLLSIDIDSTDLWIWRALGEAGYRPRVLIIEYNRNWPLGNYNTFPDTSGLFSDAPFPVCEQTDTMRSFFLRVSKMPCFAMSLQSVEWEGDCFMGASLSALKLLGDDFGYVLLGTDNEAVNAFFLRKDVYAKEVGAHPPPTLAMLHPVPRRIHR